MMTRKELAVARFREGFHCSQAVLEAWAPECGLDPILARKMATTLAGGSGLGGECGALTGAFLVIGAKWGMSRADDTEGFLTAISKVGDLAARFKSLHGTMNCRELLGLDVFSEQGFREFQEKNVKLNRCVQYVEDTMNLLEQMLEESSPVK